MREWTPVGNWQVVDRMRVDEHDLRWRDVIITVECCDVRSSRTAEVWSEGAYRVTSEPRTWVRTRTFVGETAHQDAPRYARDEQARLARTPHPDR